jgi:hypothetical protein
MSLKVQDLGELAYGGLVTGLSKWDEKRITDGKLVKKDILKKASFYGYVIPGVVATAATAMNWMPKQSEWTERIAHGFIYGFPGFAMDLIDSMKTTTTSYNAIAEAERIARAASSRRTNTAIRETPQPGWEGARRIY